MTVALLSVVVGIFLSVLVSVQNSSSNFGGRILNITFVVNPGAGDSDVVVRASVTGRNTQYGYPVSVCDDIPPSS